MMANSDKGLRALLTKELQARKFRNPRYSLRAFSRDLKLSPAILSEALSGKRVPTPATTKRIAQALSLDETALRILIEESRRGKSLKREAQRARLVSASEFNVISDWYFLAILNLANVPGEKSHIDHLASRLGLSEQVVSKALSVLTELGMIRIRDGILERTTAPLVTANDIPSEAIRKYHRKNLELASRAIGEVDVSLREFSAVTLAFDPSQIDFAKKLIRKFKEKFGIVCSQRGTSEEVYTLAIQFFPVTRKSSKQRG